MNDVKRLAPFQIRHGELRYIKRWLRGQVVKGNIDIGLPAIGFIAHDDDARRIIEFLDIDGRKRLQKALSTQRKRNTRKDSATKTVVTELTPAARDILASVARSRGITTSDLIESTFTEEFLGIDAK
ncbi:Uncharacterised protein [BD1-7 clade bacterium]|uniref:Uncharacterized protein n=1 Tax=BD1-7 clade bacterium TaxID=2029982 RepID=A0A5S9QR84_9GAMM|nr:Uncharacterised protein [BD1-7 clade bacterium]CAA0120719.1 Uncharacterised protein [BD1-7 clade bacterium]